MANSFLLLPANILLRVQNFALIRVAGSVGFYALLRHRFEKFVVTSVHAYADSLFRCGDRFQKFAVTVRVCFGRVDARRNLNKMFAYASKSGYVWTGPRKIG